MSQQPQRFLNTEDVAQNRPVHAVWEITLACDLKCRHCGSRAGRRRPDELSTGECLQIVDQLARLGTREITLIGGEAYLRSDWTEIIRAIAEAGMMCTLQTGGRNLSEKRVKEAKAAGLAAAGVSIDGLRKLHDDLRGVPGSFDAALASLERLRRHGIISSVNTQITASVTPQLPELMELFIEKGVKNWQVQLTVAMGRAADRPDILLQPYQMLELMPRLAEIYQQAAPRGLLLQPGNNIGYFGPYEHFLRGSGDDRVHWNSCTAGRNAIGIEADGTIKGCPSLPTVSYAGGNIRQLPVEEIWNSAPQLSFARRQTRQELWGFCRSCYYADVCLGGCTWTAHSLLGRKGNNPYCHHRALELARQGLRERIEPVEKAPGHSFDHGRFDLILETLSGEQLSISRDDNRLYPLEGASSGTTEQLRPGGAKLSFLGICRGCRQHVFPGTQTCPHCGSSVGELAASFAADLNVAREAERTLLDLLVR